jgi:hypothetical protein
MPRFPKARRKNKPLSIFEQARRFYGQAFDASTPRDLADSMADWGELGAAERTFTLSHLLYLNLMSQAGVQALLHQLLVTVEDVADDLDEGAGEHEDDDLEDEHEPEPEPEPEAEDLDGEAGQPESVDAPPSGVTIPGSSPSVITPPADVDDDEDHEGDDQGDWQEPDDLDEGDEG